MRRRGLALLLNKIRIPAATMMYQSDIKEFFVLGDHTAIVANSAKFLPEDGRAGHNSITKALTEPQVVTIDHEGRFVCREIVRAQASG